MRGRIVGHLLRRPSLFPCVIQLPSSEEIVRPFSARLCPTPSGFLGETTFSSSHVCPLFKKYSGRDGLLQGSHSCIAHKSVTCHHELHPGRAIPPSGCCQCTLAESSPASTYATPLLIRRFTNVSGKGTERRCWSCEQETSTENRLFCSSCKAIQPLDPTVDFFQIFSIDRSFKVDLKELEQTYKSLQKKLHPDLAGSKSETEREYSADQSAHVIQAYYILIRPLSRARYLLGLQGINLEEGETIDDPELLMEIMEIRESISEISDTEALRATQAENDDRISTCEKELEACFIEGDVRRTVSWTQRLTYYIKVGEEILRKL